MIHRASTLLLAALAGGCAMGPSYHPKEVVPATTKVGAARQAQLRQLAAAVQLYRALGGSWPASSKAH